MKIRVLAVTTALLILLALPRLSRAGIEGTYHLDKRHLVAQVRAKIAKLPPRQRAFGRMMMMMLNSLKMSITLASGGKSELFFEMKMFGKHKKEHGVGTWTQKGNVVTISTTHKGRGGKVKKDKIRCTHANGVLTCVKKGKRKKEVLRFIKGKAAGASKPAKRAAAPAPRR